MPEGGMEGTVKTPFGPMKKKTVAIAGVGAGGVIIIVWYRSKQSAAAAPTATPTTITDPDGNVCAALNPATGFCPGTPGDIQASNVAYGYNQSGTYQQAFTGGYGGYPPSPGQFTTNGQWAQFVEQYLVDSAGADATTVAAALGKYITGQPMTADQISIAQQAIAFGGYPPVSGPNGNPPGFITGGTGGGGGGTVAVPNVIGKNRKDSAAALTAVGLVYKQANIIRGTAHASAESPVAGTMVATGSTVIVTMKKG
jgi:hypothetical protein